MYRGMWERRIAVKRLYHSKTLEDPLIAAALNVLVAEGLSAVRSRALARLSGESAAAVSRRFGSQDTLIQEALRQGLELECARFDRLTNNVMRLTRPSRSQADLLLSVLFQTHSVLPSSTSLRWLVSAHEADPRVPAEASAKLHDASTALWSEVALKAGWSSEDGRILHGVLEGFARGHLLTAFPIVFTGWLQDVCRRLACRLNGDDINAKSGSWRDELERSVDPLQSVQISPFSETKVRIIDAAARCLVNVPLAKISHRSIAAQADVSLSSMTHHFRTLQEVLWFGCLRMIDEMLADSPQAGMNTGSQTFGELAALFHTAASGPLAKQLDRLEQLQLHCYHTEAFSAFGDHFLLRQGQNSMSNLTSLSDAQGPFDRLDAVILHHLSIDLISTIRRSERKHKDEAATLATGDVIRRLFG